MQQKNEDAENLQEKFQLYECATCDQRFPYLYSFKDCQIFTSVMNESLTSLKGFLSVHATKNEDAGNPQENSGYRYVRQVTKDFLIFTLSKTVKYVLE